MNPKITILIALLMALSPMAALPIEAQPIDMVLGEGREALVNGGLEGAISYDPDADIYANPSEPHTIGVGFDLLYGGAAITPTVGSDNSKAANLANEANEATNWNALGQVRVSPQDAAGDPLPLSDIDSFSFVYNVPYALSQPLSLGFYFSIDYDGDDDSDSNPRESCLVQSSEIPIMETEGYMALQFDRSVPVTMADDACNFPLDTNSPQEDPAPTKTVAPLQAFQELYPEARVIWFHVQTTGAEEWPADQPVYVDDLSITANDLEPSLEGDGLLVDFDGFQQDTATGATLTPTDGLFTIEATVHQKVGDIWTRPDGMDIELVLQADCGGAYAAMDAAMVADRCQTGTTYDASLAPSYVGDTSTGLRIPGITGSATPTEFTFTRQDLIDKGVWIDGEPAAFLHIMMALPSATAHYNALADMVAETTDDRDQMDALEELLSFTPVVVVDSPTVGIPVLSDGFAAAMQINDAVAESIIPSGTTTFTLDLVAYHDQSGDYVPYSGDLKVTFRPGDASPDGWKASPEGGIFTVSMVDGSGTLQVDVADLPRSSHGYQVAFQMVGDNRISLHSVAAGQALASAFSDPPSHPTQAAITFADALDGLFTPVFIEDHLNPVDDSGTEHDLIVHLPRQNGQAQYAYLDGIHADGTVEQTIVVGVAQAGTENVIFDSSRADKFEPLHIDGIGTIDYDTDADFGTCDETQPDCDNSIDEDSTQQPTILLIDLDDPVTVPGTEALWDDGEGLTLDRIHIKRAGDDGTAFLQFVQLYSDIDDDGYTDNQEYGLASCGTNPTNPAAHCDDWDGDGIDNDKEDTAGWDRSKPDMDGDGLKDGEEDVNGNGVVDSGESDPTTPHSDSDTLTDGQEVKDTNDPVNCDPDCDGGYGTDPTKADTDNDTFNDDVEVAEGSDPLDGASIPGDVDNDGLLDSWEDKHFGDDSGTVESSDLSPQDGTGDPDSDGLNNLAEQTAGTDPNDPDSDDDGLDDGTEDADADGVVDPSETDPNNPDTDGDLTSHPNGANDGDEVAAGSDPLDPESVPGDVDGDDLGDAWENQYFGNLDQGPDDDPDVDGLTNLAEHDDFLTDPTAIDTDSDDLDDGREVRDRDDPQRCMEPGSLFNPLACDGGYGTDPNDTDSDDDGLTDGAEVDVHGTNPREADTDDDGSNDGAEVAAGSDPLDPEDTPGNPDVDGDDLDDAWEEEHFGDRRLQDGSGDPDGDGLNNEGEETYGTDPLHPDTDLDGIPDGAEVDVHGTNPREADTDGDGLMDLEELLGESCLPASGKSFIGGTILYGANFPPIFCDDPRIREATDPALADTDGDGLTDGEETKDTEDPVHCTGPEGEDPCDRGEYTDPTNPDTDGDGLIDGRERKDRDDPWGCDADLENPCDGGYGSLAVDDPSITTDNVLDSDKDGLGDAYEADTPYPADCGPDMEGVCTVDFQLDSTDDDENGIYDVTDGSDPESYSVGKFGCTENCRYTEPAEADSDNDGVGDGEELIGTWTVVQSSTLSGTFTQTHPALADTDSDGLSDGEEVKDRDNPVDCTATGGNKCDNGYGTDPHNPHSDGDGLTDGEEANGVTTHGRVFTSDPTEVDTDGDGMPDWQEVRDTNDLACTTCDGGYGTDPSSIDTDDDWLGDVVELFQGLPETCDADGDGACRNVVTCELTVGKVCVQVKITTTTSGETLSPSCGVKGDNDACQPGAAVCSTGCTDPHDPDKDNDGLRDGEEVRGTWAVPGTGNNVWTDEGVSRPSNPHLDDTDNDGILDGFEVKDRDDPNGCVGLNRKAERCDRGHELDPSDPSTHGIPDAQAITDTDGDGLLDGHEVTGVVWTKSVSTAQTNNGYYKFELQISPPSDPNSKDSDNDGIEDGVEVKDLDDPVNCTPPGQDPGVGLLSSTDCDGGYWSSPSNTDTDGDGLEDKEEIDYVPTDLGCRPNTAAAVDNQNAVKSRSPVCDPDRHPSPALFDTDGDGLLDGEDLTVPASDSRYDSFANAGVLYVEDAGGRRFLGEEDYGTDPTRSDTDGDQTSDGDEVANEFTVDGVDGSIPAPSDPTDATSTPETQNVVAAAVMVANTLRVPDIISALNADGGNCNILAGDWATNDPTPEVSEEGLLDDDLWDRDSCGDQDGGDAALFLLDLVAEVEDAAQGDPKTLLPRPEDFPLPNQVDRLDPHDTDGDGDRFEPNGQLDPVEESWFYVDFDEEGDDAQDRFDGDNDGFTAYLMNNRELVLVVRVGDVEGTPDEEEVVVERHDGGSASQVICVAYDATETPYLRSGDHAYREDENTPCGGPVTDVDQDGDGLPNTQDNCPTTSNTGQTDTDGDGVGDDCDDDRDGDGLDNGVEDANGDGVVDSGETDPDNADTDGDGFSDGDSVPTSSGLTASDNCPTTSNADQTDTDGDNEGDACDTDDDNDDVDDGADNCPTTSNSTQTDTDSDGIGDACDTDADNDGVDDVADNCPTTSNADQTDTDGDNEGDACDTDDDNDGVDDGADNCPTTSNADQTDTDSDGIGDACDTDDDNDGVDDAQDNCPSIGNTSQLDTDSDGIGDACDTDDDNDSVNDGSDNCPTVANANQDDADNDGVGDACEDTDSDGLMDSLDNCPTDANADQADFEGDGQGDACDTDDDNDGLTDYEETNAVRVNGGTETATGYSATNPKDADSDDDGLTDGEEIFGTRNPYDDSGNLVGPGDPGASTDPNNANSDGDRLDDGEEIKDRMDPVGCSESECDDEGYGSDPNNPDTDGDGKNDDRRTTPNGDYDDDGFTNAEEQAQGSDRRRRSSTPDNKDGDLLTDEEEEALGPAGDPANPMITDTPCEDIDENETAYLCRNWKGEYETHIAGFTLPKLSDQYILLVLEAIREAT